MAVLVWITVLLLPITLPASEFLLTAGTRPPLRLLFAQDAPPNPAPEEDPKDFANHVLGSQYNVYPYHAPFNDRKAQPSRSSRNAMATPGLLEARIAPIYSSDRGMGLSADAYATFLFFGAGGAARWWGRGEDGNSDASSAYGWVGFNFTVPPLSVSVGGAYGYLGLPDGDLHAGFSLTARVTAYPLWPLSFSADASLGSMSGVVFDTGGSVGVMVYRHLFVEVGYRYGAAYQHDFAAHGLTIGIQFAWNWANTSFGPFDSPRHPWTW